MIELAKHFAIAAHSAVGQLRKYTNEPYWVHPQEVADVVTKYGGTPSMICAAWLHDTIEDTQVTIDVIDMLFGSEIASLVHWLTEASTHADGNRATRKQIDREFLARAPYAAQSIKLADIISNTRSIADHDVDFAIVYVKEIKQLLDVLNNCNDELKAVAVNTVAAAELKCRKARGL